MRKTKAAGFVLTFVFLGLVFWKTDFVELGQAFRTANYAYLAPAALCTLVSYLLRTARWGRILAPTKRVPVLQLFPVLMIGFMANNVLPARLGELVRAYTLGRKERISRSLSFATILLERLLDGLTLVAFLALLSFVLPLPGWGFEIAYFASAVFLAAVIGVLVLLFEGHLAQRVIALALRPLPRELASKLLQRADSFILGLDALRKKRTVLLLLAFSFVIWSVEAGFYFLVLRGFSPSLAPASALLAAVLMLVVVNLGIMLPSAPGYVGTFQFFAVLALGTFAIQRELALSVAIVAHGVQYLLVTGLGLAFFWHENMSLRQIQQLDEVTPEVNGV